MTGILRDEELERVELLVLPHEAVQRGAATPALVRSWRARPWSAQAGLGAPTAAGSSEEGALGGSIWRCGNQSSQRGRYQLR